MLKGDDLGLKIKTNLKTVFTEGVKDEQMDMVCKAIGNAVIDYIKSNAEVDTTVSGSCENPAGVGTISGTGKGTVK